MTIIPPLDDRPGPAGDHRLTFDIIAFALGVALAVVGWLDLAVLWYPFDFSNSAWEFGTISAHFDGMPLGTLGLALVAAGVSARGERRPARILAVVLVLIALTLLAVYALYLFDVPMALSLSAAQVGRSMRLAIIKTSIFAVTYIVFYAWLAWHVWRMAGPPRRTSTRH